MKIRLLRKQCYYKVFCLFVFRDNQNISISVTSVFSSSELILMMQWYLDGPLSPFQFYRDWIGPNKPCIIHNAFSDWPALSRHSNNTRWLLYFVTLQIFFMLKQQHYRLTKHYFSVVHKNHYGNLYCVISGQKEFILLLPMDRPFIPYGKEHFLYPAVSFVLTWPQDYLFEIADEEDTTKVMLYLPSLWFQHVQQPHGCIAVNFWYNMECDIKYNYFQLVESLTNATTGNLQLN
uniref:Jumonji domain containing 7 n=1 Tax=Cyprinus carpio TaxID=7962 RepID=A0A8C1GMN2_CYPCA